MSKQSDMEDELDLDAFNSMRYGIVATPIIAVIYFVFFFNQSFFWVIFAPLLINLLIIIIGAFAKDFNGRGGQDE